MATMLGSLSQKGHKAQPDTEGIETEIAREEAENLDTGHKAQPDTEGIETKSARP